MGTEIAAGAEAATVATGVLSGVISAGLTVAINYALSQLLAYLARVSTGISDVTVQLQNITERAKLRGEPPLQQLVLALGTVQSEAEDARRALAKVVASNAENRNFIADPMSVEAYAVALKRVQDLEAKTLGIAKQVNAERARGVDANEARLVQEAQLLGSALRAGQASEAQVKRATELRRAYTEVVARSDGADLASLERRSRAQGILDALEEKRARRAASQPRADTRDLEAVNRQLDALTKRSDEANRAIGAALARSSADLAQLAGDAAAVLGSQIDEVTRKFRALGASESEIARIVAPLEAARKAATALNGAAAKLTIPPAAARELGLVDARAEDAASSARTLADTISDVADTALGIATAFGGADARLTRLIQGAAQLASAFAKVGTLAEKAGGIGALFSTGAGIASAIPALGGIIGGIGAVLSGLFATREDPAAAALVENLRKNSDRLVELRAGLDKLALSLGGSELAGIRDVRLVTTRRIPIGETGGFGTAEDPRPVRDILADLRAAGVSLGELRKAAEEFGISLSESPTVDELRQLQQAIRELDVAKLFQSVEGLLKLNDVDDRLNPGRSPLDALKKDLAVLAGPGGADVFKEVAALVEAGDFEGAKQRIRDFFEEMRAPGFDFSTLGGLSPDEFLQFLTEIFDGITAAAPKVRTAAEQFSDALTAWATAVELGSLSADEALEKAKTLFTTLFPDLAKDIDFSSLETFKASLQGIIDGFAADGELTEAEQAQITVIRQLIGSFDAAATAAAEAAVAVETFADAVRDAFDAADEEIELFNITDAIDQVQLAFDKLGALFPEMAALFGQFSIATEEGRKALEAALIAWIQTLPSGEERDAGLAVLRRLRAIPGGTAAADTGDGGARGGTTRSATGVQTITERTANALVDFTRTGVRQRDVMITLLRDVVGALGMPRAPLLPPALPSPTAGRGMGGAASIETHIDARVMFTGPVTVSDPKAFGREVATAQADRLRPEINRALGAAFLDHRNFRGGYP